MAAQTETDVLKTELELVNKVLPALFEVEDTFFSQVEKRNVKVVSFKQMRVPMKMWPGGKSGSFDPAGGDLGRGSGPKYDEANLSPVSTKHAIEWQLKAEWATDDSRKAIINAARETTAEAMAEYRRFLDCCVVYGQGNGILGTISAVSANSPVGSDTYTCDSEFGVRLLRYNHNVTIYQSNLSAVRHANVTEIEITNIDYPNKTFTTATQANPGQVNDVIVHSGLSGATPTSFYGMHYHHNNASSGTWMNMNRATYPQIRANGVNANGSLSLSHARLAKNKIGERLGMNAKVKAVAWMHPCQKQVYEEMGQLVQVINRTGGSSQGLDLYFDVQQLCGSPIKEHFAWSKKRIDFVVPDVWGRGEVSPVSWFKNPAGGNIFPVYSTSTGGVVAAFLSYITSSFNYFVTKPPAISYIYGLTIPSGY